LKESDMTSKDPDRFLKLVVIILSLLFLLWQVRKIAHSLNLLILLCINFAKVC
jgi:hypothetical protein